MDLARRRQRTNCWIPLIGEGLAVDREDVSRTHSPNWLRVRIDIGWPGMWTLDPIDGTKGFLRGGQYAVCLSLVVDAQVELGVIGCPNLPVDPSNPDGARGCLFVAVRGQGSQQITMSTSDQTPLSIPAYTPSTLSFLESVEAAHSSHSFNSLVSELMHIQKPPVRMDSQAKYCCLARGEGGAYLRMPTGVGYREKIWVCFYFVLLHISSFTSMGGIDYHLFARFPDLIQSDLTRPACLFSSYSVFHCCSCSCLNYLQDHAPGSLLVTEAGGTITDSRGELLNFGLGRDLGENFGIVAAGKSVHDDVLAAIKLARLREEETEQRLKV